MFQDKFVFAQFTAFLDKNHFNYLVRKHGGDKYVNHFSCGNQLLALMFGQLSNRESLRDLIIAIEAHQGKAYYLSLGKHITRSNLAKANQNRDYHIFESYAYYMIEQARSKRKTDIFKLGGNVYAFDSTTIDLCLNIFWWAKFRKQKGGIKIHTLYDLETQIPAFFHITTASIHDSKVMDEIPYQTGAYYVFDRGYNSFKSLHKIETIGSYFVVRAKTNLQFKAKSWKRRLPKNVLSDAIGELTYNSSNLIRSRYGRSVIGTSNKSGSSPSSPMLWSCHLCKLPNFIETDGRLNCSSNGSNSILRLRSSGAIQRTLSEYRFTLQSSLTASSQLLSMICALVDLYMKYYRFSAYHLLIKRT